MSSTTDSITKSISQSSGSLFIRNGPWPATPPAKICGNPEFLDGLSKAPSGAVIVPPGNNESVDFSQAGKTYWFKSGIHTLGTDKDDQIIPGDNSIFIGAPGAILDGQHKNLFAFTQHAKNVSIKYLTIRNFKSQVNNSVVNHNSGKYWTITHNTIIDNGGSGVLLATGDVVSYNCLKNNGQYGFQSFGTDGVKNIVLDHNEIVGNNTMHYQCSGCAGGGKFWKTHGAKVTNNWVHDNHDGPGLWADTNNEDFVFKGNYINDNDAEGIFYEISFNFVIKHNTFIRNALTKGKEFAKRTPFPVGALYISESGGNRRAGHQYAKSQIKGNYLQNNWDGIVLWENANRFCRPDEPFSYTNGCPFFDHTRGTRFKTQNISIKNNMFVVDKDAIGCTTSRCARMGLFSNRGTYPDYPGDVIKRAITFQQNNHWKNNTYIGPWRFVPYDVNRNINFDDWQSSPYNQDKNSRIKTTVQ